MGRLAVFDLDHTLIKGNSSFLFGQFLFRIGYLSLRTTLSLAWDYFLHKRGFLSLKDLHYNVFQKFLEGKSLFEVMKYSEDFIKRHLPSILYQPTLQRLQDIRLKGGKIAILSSSPSFLVEAIALYLKVDIWLATHYQIDEKSCFHQVSNIVEGVDKARFLKNIQSSYGIKTSDVIAYSDSLLDLPLLEAAGLAVGVVGTGRIDKKFYDLCQKRGWEMI